MYDGENSFTNGVTYDNNELVNNLKIVSLSMLLSRSTLYVLSFLTAVD
jgi:hypothetical protein